MTDEEAAAIAARAEAATPGPWELLKSGNIPDRWPVVHSTSPRIQDTVFSWFPDPWREQWYSTLPVAFSDAAFIAHARSDIPALLAERAELRALLRRFASYATKKRYADDCVWCGEQGQDVASHAADCPVRQAAEMLGGDVGDGDSDL